MKYVCYMLAVGWTVLSGLTPAHGQAYTPIAPGQLRAPGQMPNYMGNTHVAGGATLSDATHGTSQTPLGVTQLGQPAAGYSGRSTPGSTLGLVQGGYGGGPIGGAVGGAVSGQFQTTPLGTGTSAWSPGASGAFAPMGSGAFSGSGATPALGGGGFGFSAPSLSPAMPALPGASTGGTFGPTASPAADSSGTSPKTSEVPPASKPETVLTDTARSPAHSELFLKASEKFRNAAYRECISLVKVAVENGEASVEVWQLYIASLVANNSVSLAAYEAAQAAKAYPRTFMTDRSLLDLYKDNPDRALHYGLVEEVGKTAMTPEPGILWALYQRVAGGKGDDPAITLKVINVKPEDAPWFATLRASLKK